MNVMAGTSVPCTHIPVLYVHLQPGLCVVLCVLGPEMAVEPDRLGS